MAIDSLSDGGYTVESAGCRLVSDRPSIETSESGRVSLAFGAQQERRFSLGGIVGTLVSDASTSDVCEVTREVFTSECCRYTAIRFVVRNASKKIEHLVSIKPLMVSGKEALSVNGKGAEAWRIFRIPVQKSDIPGCFSPSRQDEDYDDVIFSSLGAVAGQGIVNATVDRTVRKVTSGQIVIISDETDDTADKVAVCILGQSCHLGEMALEFSEDGKTLESFEISCEFDGIELPPEAAVGSHWLMFFTGTNEPAMLEKYAEIVAVDYHVPVPQKQPMALYCSWYFYTINVTQAHIEEEIKAIKEKSIPIEAFIIDNGWLNEFGTYDANDKFPDGMAYVADKIKDAGMMPGIWTCPAIIDKKSVYLEKYPDLPARKRDGGWLEFVNADSEAYIIDPTAPSATAYYREVYGKIKSWGYLYHKLDYLRSLIEHADIQYQDPRVNRAMAYRLMLSHVRNALGAECYVCGCGGIADAANLGLMDAYRTSKDVRNVWSPVAGNRINSAIIQIKQNLFRNYSRRFWHPDPDSTLIRLRDKQFFKDEKKRIGVYLSEGHYSDEEARTIVTHQYLTGGNVCISERIPELQESRLALLRHIVPVVTPPARILDFNKRICPDTFLTEVTPVCKALGIWWTLCLGNWQDEDVVRKVRLKDIPLPDDSSTFAVSEFFTQRFYGVQDVKDELCVSVPAHGVRVLRIAPWSGFKPVLLGTDHHITGGGCEIGECEMNASGIKGEIQTDWTYPIKLMFLMPQGNMKAEVVEYVVNKNESVFQL